MKPTNIQCIPEIPNSWDLSKIKYFFYISKSKAHDTNPTVLRLARSGIQVRDISTNEGQMAASYEDYNPVQPGDFLLNTMDLQSGANCNVSEISGVISPAYANLRALQNLNPKFFDYYFKCQYWAMAMFAHGKGISFDNRWTMNTDTLLNYYIPVPPIEIQNKIVDIINKKCAQVDELIANQQAQIEKLKEYKQSIITEAVTKGLDKSAPTKDSGIEWIGDIPSSWNILRGKNVLELLDKSVLPTDDVITCFRDGEVTLRKNRREEGFTFSEKEIGYQGIDIDDLVVHGMDGFAGAIGISDSRGKASPVLIVLDSMHNKRFLMYYLRSLAYRDIFLALSTGIRVRSCDLRWNKLSTLQFLVPSIEEQNNIVAYIDNKLEQIDCLITLKEEKIEKLQEYKKSLIYEYVTGKKEVV